MMNRITPEEALSWFKSRRDRAVNINSGKLNDFVDTIIAQAVELATARAEVERLQHLRDVVASGPFRGQLMHMWIEDVMA